MKSVKSIYMKLKKYIHNTLWILSDKIISLIVGFGLSVMLARYLGPSDFGVYAYATSVTALFGVAGHMGLSGLIVKELVSRPESVSETLGTTIALKYVGVSLGYILIVAYSILFESIGTKEFWVLVVSGLSLFFLPFDVIDYWFQSHIKSRYVAIARFSGLSTGSLFKIAFVFLGFGTISFLWANIFQSMIVAAVLWVLYKLSTKNRVLHWKVNWNVGKDLLSKGWKVYLGSIFAVVYLKIDQVMLRWIEGQESVGVYAVASQLSEAWYFIPIAIVSSIFPKLLALKSKSQKEFDFRFQQLMDLLLLLSVFISIVVTICAEQLINIFYNDSYFESSDVLIIHIWSSVFIFMRAAFSRWILIENELMFSIVTQGAGAIINIVLNFILIPVYGVKGAASATLISYAFASFISLLFHKKTRPVFIIMLKSFLLPFRVKSWKMSL